MCLLVLSQGKFLQLKLGNSQSQQQDDCFVTVIKSLFRNTSHASRALIMKALVRFDLSYVNI